MNKSLFWRLAWKEYRVLRSYWISLVVIFVLLQVVVLAIVRSDNVRRDARNDAVAMCVVALTGVALYAMGAGAALFAAEREDRTDDFLRVVPTTGTRLFAAKVSVGAFSSLVMFLLLGILAVGLAEWTWPSSPDADWLRQYAIAVFECFVWSLFWSLLVRRPIIAAILGAASALFVLVLLIWLGTKLNPGYLPRDLSALTAARLAIVAGMLVVDAWLATRWLPDRLPARSDVGSRAGEWRFPRVVALARLVWLGWRQSRTIMLVLAIVGAIFLPLALAIIMMESFGGKIEDEAVGGALGVGVAIAALVGAMVFGADQQERQFRFFAEHAVRPRDVWLARQSFGLAAALGACAFIVVANVLFFTAVGVVHEQSGPYLTFSQALRTLPSFGACLGLVLLAYACGQFASLAASRAIVAAVVGLGMLALTWGWVELRRWAEAPWWWSVAPIPLMLMFITWWKTPRWILERHTWRSRLQTAALVIVPALALIVGVYAYRILSIPNTGPGFSPEEFLAEQATAGGETTETYAMAVQLIRPQERRGEGVIVDETPQPGQEQSGESTDPWSDLPSKEATAWVAANSPAIEMALQANARPGEVEYVDHQLGDLLLKSARALEAEGKLDEALDRYVATLQYTDRHETLGHFSRRQSDEVWHRLKHWGTRPGQTPERIQRAVDKLQAFESTPPPTNIIKHFYVTRWKPLVDAPPEETVDGTRNTASPLDRAFVWLLRLEQPRWRRVLDVVTAEDLGTVRKLERALAENQSAVELLPPTGVPRYESRLIEKTIAFPAAGAIRAGDPIARAMVATAALRRATLLILALEAWRLEHGKLPLSLGALKDQYLPKLPVDPYSGRQFAYNPFALQGPKRGSGGPDHQVWLAHPVPIVWSTGDDIRYSAATGQFEERVTTQGEPDRWRPIHESEAYSEGLRFPIPSQAPASEPVAPPEDPPKPPDEP